MTFFLNCHPFCKIPPGRGSKIENKILSFWSKIDFLKLKNLYTRKVRAVTIAGELRNITSVTILISGMAG